MLAFVVCRNRKKTEELPRNKYFCIYFISSLSKKRFAASFDDVCANSFDSALKKLFPNLNFRCVNMRRKQVRR